MPFARIDLVQGKTPEYRAAVGEVVYDGIVQVLKAPEGDRFYGHQRTFCREFFIRPQFS